MNLHLKNIVLILVLVLFSAIIANSNPKTRNHRRRRLIGAETVKNPSKFPWVISLGIKSKSGEEFNHYCGGGAILSQLIIVTVAHCVWNISSIELEVLAGSVCNNVSKKHGNASSPQIIDVSKIIVHPNYTINGLNPGAFDLALLLLSEPLKFNDHVKSVKIPDDTTSNLSDFKDCFTIGRGTVFPISILTSPLEQLGFISKKMLRVVDVEIIPSIFCKIAYPFHLNELSGTICGSSGFGRGPCRGDSGNPLICFKAEIPYLIGLSSWGWILCADGIHPDIYTDSSLIRNLMDKVHIEQQLSH